MLHPSEVAERIRNTRESLGLTQAALGARLGVTRSQITLWETGGRNPSPTSLKQIAAALAVNVEWLTTGEGPSKIPTGGTQGVDEQLLELVVEAVQAAFKRRKLDTNSKRFAHTVVAVYAAGAILWRASNCRSPGQFHERLVDMADLAIGA